MVIARWHTCGQAWVELMRHVWSAGEASLDDRGPVMEAMPLLFEIADFTDDDPIIAEFGDRSLLVAYTAKFTETGVVPPFKYSYGGRLRDLLGVDQIEWVTALLAERPYSKSAWISLTVPGETNTAVPCLTALAFRVRRHQLAMTATFRSQNAFTCYLNYLPLRDIQAEVAEALSLPVGPMRVFVDVPHIYLADIEHVAAILARVPEPSAA